MLRNTMIALCTVASVAMLAPGMALARGGGGGGHGGGGGFGGGHASNFGGSFGAHASSFAAAPSGNFANSMARAPNGNVGAVQGNRFASGNFARGGFNHGFRHHRHFVGGFFVDDGWGYPDYAYDDTYSDDGGCYIVQQRVHTAYGWRIRPVQVCG